LTSKHKDKAQPESKVDETMAPEAGEAAQSPEERIAALEAELQQAREEVLRAHAEMENVRRRTQREVEDARRFAIEKFATALLDVVDNLERALAVPEGNEKALRDGMRLTLDSWMATIGRFGMERVEAEGTPFDPHHHEALAHVPHEAEEGTVVAQHVAGYLLNGRLIRPAKVLVSRGKDEDDAGA
jgi:molecular chaperone GrpE